MKSSARLKICLYVFAVSQLVSIFADRLKQFSLVGMVGLVNPGSSAELLSLSLCMHLPMLLCAPLFGALLDRWNRSGVILAVDVIRAALILIVPATFGWTGSLYSIYFLVVFIAVADLMFSPARSALIPALAVCRVTALSETICTAPPPPPPAPVSPLGGGFPPPPPPPPLPPHSGVTPA